MTFDEWVVEAYKPYRGMDGFELNMAAIKGGMVSKAWEAGFKEGWEEGKSNDLSYK